MKRMIKLLTLVMVLIMLLSAFIGCNNNAKDDGALDDMGDEDEYDYFPEVERNDYGTEFTMYMCSINNFPEFYVLEESNGSPMDEAVYARQEKIKRYLGVEMINKVDSNTNRSDYIAILRDAVNNKDGTLEMLLSHYNIGIPQLISESYLMDFNDLDAVNLDAEYWNLPFMDSIELKGHRYLGFGDCNILFAYLISFNKGMMEQYSNAEVFEGKTPYELVDDYEWTLDKMMAIANLVYIDNTGDGKTDDDKFGYSAVAWEPYMSYIHASGMNIMEQDASGSYKVMLNSDKYYSKIDTVINKLADLSESECAWVDYGVKVVHDSTALSLTSNRVLMSVYDTIHLPEYLNYDIEFGVLPLPMYDSNQKQYRALQYGGNICIPTYVKDKKMVGETLEMYNFYSSNVKVTFYEKVLGKQVADVPDDARMLDIIWAGVCTDVGFTYQNTTTVANTMNWETLGGCMVRLTNPAGSEGGLSSWFARHVNAQQDGFDNFYKGLK